MHRFVVLEHTWKGLHWDVMIETPTGLATWAVDEPIEPGRDLATRQLAVHRLDYLDYEGPIGGDRGSVRRIDRGWYEVERWDEQRVVLILRGQTFRGRAEIWLVPGSSDEIPLSERRWAFRLGNRD